MTKKVKKIAKKTAKKSIKKPAVRAKTDKAFAEFGKKLKTEKQKSMAKILPVENQSGAYYIQQAEEQSKEKQDIKVSPVVDSTGVVMMVPVDEIK